MREYDYLVVGAGLFGSVFAHHAGRAGKKVLVIEKRPHPGGNVYGENIAGIHVHQYGAHIFHTGNKKIWDWVNSFTPFNRYTNAPLANYQGRLYNLPFNMNTFYALWGVRTPAEAMAKIEAQRKEAGITGPRNLEEQAIALAGRDIYETLIKGYTEKQWGRSCRELPAFIIRRIPLRFTFDNNYFDDEYQGIPEGGYNPLIAGLLEGLEVRTGVDFFSRPREYWEALAERVVYTGTIDAFYRYRFGKLEYRTLRFELETLDCANYQGNAVINYTDAAIPYIRVIEHKHFARGEQPQTVISREYPLEWREGTEPLYPVNDEKNTALFNRYWALASSEPQVFFGGRLAEYRYYDMDEVIEKALASAEKWLAPFGSPA